MENKTIGKRFKEARQHLRLFQGDISKETGLSQVKISYFETGKKKSLYNEYTDFLINKGIRLEWLLRGAGEMMIGSSENKEKEDDVYLNLQSKIESLEVENKDLRLQIAKFQTQIENLTVSLNRFVNFIMDSGMQMLPKQQIVGQQQQDFNTAGVSSQFLVANIMIEYYLKALKVG